MKSAIYEFDPVIYPVRLWVCKKPAVEDIDALFYPFDTRGDVVDDWGNPFDDTGKYASTFIVAHKEDHIRGCLVAILRPGECGAGCCSHEALHFIAYCSEQFDIPLGTFDTSEPLAYLEQWATNCIDCVLRGHPERMNGKLIE